MPSPFEVAIPTELPGDPYERCECCRPRWDLYSSTTNMMVGMGSSLNLTCKAVLFDMDGTLVDSGVVVERAWGRWAARHGIPLEVLLSFSHGRPTIATMEHFLPARDHTEELEEMDRYEETQLEGILAVPGAAQIVHALQNHSWAIVTSAYFIQGPD